MRRGVVDVVELSGADAWHLGALATDELPAGSTRLYFRPHATRSRARYGAMQPNSYFETEEAREAAIAKYLAGARKRAAKMAGGAA